MQKIKTLLKGMVAFSFGFATWAILRENNRCAAPTRSPQKRAEKGSNLLIAGFDAAIIAASTCGVWNALGGIGGWVTKKLNR